MASYTPFLSESYLNIFHSFKSSFYLFSLTLDRNSKKKKKKKRKKERREGLIEECIEYGDKYFFHSITPSIKN
jgi:hypothetical protein